MAMAARVTAFLVLISGTLMVYGEQSGVVWTTAPPMAFGGPLSKVTAALVTCMSPALAETLVSTSHCKFSRYYGYDSCRTTWTKIPDPVRNPEQERLDAIALQKEDAKWEAFCKPSFKADAYGVRRASYATKGCEFGRSE